MKYAPALLALFISGCATPEQIAARQAAEAQAQEQRDQAYTNALAGQCEAIGYQRFTDPWRQCLLQLHGQNQANRAAVQGVILQQYLQNQRPAYQPPAYRAPVQTNCQRDAWGNTYCSTY